MDNNTNNKIYAEIQKSPSYCNIFSKNLKSNLFCLTRSTLGSVIKECQKSKDSNEENPETRSDENFLEGNEPQRCGAMLCCVSVVPFLAVFEIAISPLVCLGSAIQACNQISSEKKK